MSLSPRTSPDRVALEFGSDPLPLLASPSALQLPVRHWHGETTEAHDNMGRGPTTAGVPKIRARNRELNWED
ncbi:hypothetical protein PtA15_11A267 [Puccinia triticina]|uniref:Uncharacterized protein n=1 Tax=Puccinia triticina TaxID=208348 RepID=A0ABY7D3S8_9BASI|nr:uncharacterized protein PtA15_11A267 [Puccinia triticina]WAQ89577.1 hypothetical protein PtA15_11A267 [Puccinia triticina]